MAKMRTLSPKQQRFCEEYLIDLNATQAAIRAGYKAKRAYATGWENLKKPEIQKCLQGLMDARSERTRITADKVLDEIAKLAFSNILHYASFDDDRVRFKPSDDLNREEAACISEVSADVVTTESGDDYTRTTRKLALSSTTKSAHLNCSASTRNCLLKR